LPVSSRTLRDSGVTFVALAGGDAEVVLAWSPDRVAPALAGFAAIVREAVRELDPIAAG
jgi:hypothetical protein